MSSTALISFLVRCCAVVLLAILWLCPATNEAQEKARAVPQQAPKRAAKKAIAKAEIVDQDIAQDEKTAEEAEVADDGVFDALKVKGPLDKAAEPMAKLLQLKWKGKSLTFDLPNSYQEANESINEIRQASNGGSSGHGSDNFWMQSFYGQTISGVMQKGQQNFGRPNEKLQPNQFQVWIVEVTDRNREVQVSGDDMNDFNIVIRGGIDPYIFHMRHTKDGKVSVHEISGTEAFSASSESFEDFCQENSDYVKSRLVPILKKHGVKAPVTRYNPVAKDQVLLAIARIDTEREAAFKEKFAKLDSKEFEEREAASKTLEAEFDEWKEFIRRAMSDEDYTFETRARLTKLVKEKSTPEDNELLALVASAKLKDDAAYLVWLLDQTEKPEQIADIFAQLAKVTGQKIGDDVAGWKTWLAAQKAENPVQKTPSAFVNLTEETGLLQSMAVPISNLIKLKLEDGRLALDRKYWADQFNGKTIQELTDEARAEIEKRNLPPQWFGAQVSNLGPDVDYPHVLFQKIQYAVPPDTQPNYYGYNNIYAYRNSVLNKYFEQPHIKATLDLQPNFDPNARRAQVSNTPELFRLSISERRDASQTLEIYEGKDKSLRILVAGLRANSFVSLNQAADGKCTLHDVRGDQVESFSADNFQDLYSQHKEYFEAKAYPILACYGLQVSQELGGPLKIENKKPPEQK